jgi:hypothetical protein
MERSKGEKPGKSSGEKKRLNHTIPKFLLNRFASKVIEKKNKPDKHLIFEIPRDAPPRERGTSQVAVQSHFYGKESTKLEDALMRAETKFASVLRELDAGTDPGRFGDELSHYVWLQAVRTPALRNQVSTAFGRVLSGAGDLMLSEEGFQRAIKRADIGALVREEIDRKLVGVPASVKARILAYTNSPEFKEQLLVHLNEPEAKRSTNFLIAEFMRRATDPAQISLMTERGHIHATAKLVQERSVPGALKNASWRVMRYADQPLILGDCCAFYVTVEEGVSPILRAGMEWRAIYMPISRHSALVAEVSAGQPLWDAVRVNEASASCSHRYVYSSAVTGETERWRQLIGTNIVALGEDEFVKLLAREEGQ